MLWSGEWVWERWSRESLKRGGDSPEVAHCPRARLGLARGGVQPSSEAGFRCYGIGPLERGEVLPEGCRGWPLARPLRLPGPWAPVAKP
jgi:hypothetical protein